MAAIEPRPIPVCSPGVKAFALVWALSGGTGIVPLDGVVEGVFEKEGDELGEWEGDGSELIWGFRVAVGVLLG